MSLSNSSSKDTSLREVLITLGKIGDVNILFDNDFKDMPVSFDFTNTTFLQALDTVLSSSHNFYKVIGETPYDYLPDRPEKRAEYEETVSRTFYLSSAEVEEIARTSPERSWHPNDCNQCATEHRNDEGSNYQCYCRGKTGAGRSIRQNRKS